MADVSIRAAKAADIDEIIQLVTAAYAIYEARMDMIPGPVLADYEVLLQTETMFAADHKGRVVGVLVLFVRDTGILLDNVAVSPDAQGLGIGKALLKHAEHMARQAGFTCISLYTHETMVENIAMYARHGYEETRRVNEMGYDRVYMIKQLP